MMDRVREQRVCMLALLILPRVALGGSSHHASEVVSLSIRRVPTTRRRRECEPPPRRRSRGSRLSHYHGECTNDGLKAARSTGGKAWPRFPEPI